MGKTVNGMASKSFKKKLGRIRIKISGKMSEIKKVDTKGIFTNKP